MQLPIHALAADPEIFKLQVNRSMAFSRTNILSDRAMRISLKNVTV
jgi:hypothetical protein